MMRVIVSTAPIVCSVESTRCPVSAAESAAHTVSGSRISPIRMTSGSWRKHPLERVVEVVGVGADLALVDDRALVGVQDLDRVLDRDDVTRLVLVDVVDHRGERRRLARAGRTGDEHEPALLLGEPAADRRQAQLLHRRDARQHAAAARGPPIRAGGRRSHGSARARPACTRSRPRGGRGTRRPGPWATGRTRSARCPPA